MVDSNQEPETPFFDKPKKELSTKENPTVTAGKKPASAVSLEAIFGLDPDPVKDDVPKTSLPTLPPQHRTDGAIQSDPFSKLPGPFLAAREPEPQSHTLPPLSQQPLSPNEFSFDAPLESLSEPPSSEKLETVQGFGTLAPLPPKMPKEANTSPGPFGGDRKASSFGSASFEPSSQKDPYTLTTDSPQSPSTLQMDEASLVELSINVIRGLAMDAPAEADSGHSGTAMALAPLAYVLWTKVMRHDPRHPLWPNRDRFVLSNGHASILLYSMLYLTGYDLTIDDIRSFRQWKSRTPGHPERGHTAGVEVTTGPLGQGVGNAVGLAIAERALRNQFGREVYDHYTYVIAGDGCFEEGISHEAASLAGHLGLDHLIAIYDDNHITIDGPTDLSYSDNVEERFRSYGWNVIELGEVANDIDAIEAGLLAAKEHRGAPSLLTLRSHIGWPAPNLTDSNKAHGEVFPPDEIASTKELLGLPPDKSFFVPSIVQARFQRCIDKGAKLREDWETQMRSQGVDKTLWEASLKASGLPNWEDHLPDFEVGKSLATRQALNKCLVATQDQIPGLLAGAADLTGNTGVALDHSEAQSVQNPGGRQLYYGIREHGMGAVMNGMACHGGILPVGGTFFCFSDYMRGSVRLAALSKAKVIYSFTHDSIGLGQDGPTHQPVEHLASLRAMPGIDVVRPADANETAFAWAAAVNGKGPTALILSRQSLPILEETKEKAREGVPKGAYILADDPGRTVGVLLGAITASDKKPDVVLVATGSEVHLALAAAQQLGQQGTVARVVSMPCWEWFAKQGETYRQSVFPNGVPRLAIEAASSFGWDRYADDTVSIDTFGASAPGQVAMDAFGFTQKNVAARAVALIRKMGAAS